MSPSLPSRTILVICASIALASTGCQTILGIRTCDEPPAARMGLAPKTLAATGLYDSASTTRLAEGVVPYRPRFELFSDGAKKTRWVSLPPGAKIDTAEMDDWRFPKGTKLWKEFVRDGKKVETRHLQKIADGDGADSWLAVSYVWNAEGTEATAAPEGRNDVNGTAHDVPPARTCAGCHGGTRSFVLGLSAVQLDGTAPDGFGGSNPRGRFTTNVPLLTIPGDETTRAALGYLHANCAHCHNQHRPERVGARCFDPRTTFDLSLRTTELASANATATYRTALGTIVTAGSAEDSLLYRRLAGTATFEPRMPTLGVELVDGRGVDAVGRWIRSLR